MLWSGFKTLDNMQCCALAREWVLRRMEQALIFCRTNFDCDNLERFLNSLSGALILALAGPPYPFLA